jgi:hypothetical protein
MKNVFGFVLNFTDNQAIYFVVKECPLNVAKTETRKFLCQKNSLE